MPAPELRSYAAAVLIGRMQFFHNGHLQLLQAGLAVADKVVVVLGSAFRARNPDNPFTADERAEMIRRVLPEAVRSRVAFAPVRDYLDDARWNQAVREAVAAHTEPGSSIALVRHQKDASGYYLDHFPEWPAIGVAARWDVGATQLRKNLFEADADAIDEALAGLGELSPGPVLRYIEDWATAGHWSKLAAEHRALIRYRERWTKPVYDTADALVQAGDSVLLVRRAGVFGHGLWALPGGFVEEGESFLDAAIRELLEETDIALSRDDLERSLRGTAKFDHPGRSPRGGLISNAHHFVLPGDSRPAVAVVDEAEVLEVKWILIDELAAMEDQCFEDHHLIISRFLGVLG